MPERLGEFDFGFHITGVASEEQLKALMDSQFCSTSQLFPICSRAPLSTAGVIFGRFTSLVCNWERNLFGQQVKHLHLKGSLGQ